MKKRNPSSGQNDHWCIGGCWFTLAGTAGFSRGPGALASVYRTNLPFYKFRATSKFQELVDPLILSFSKMSVG
jgi:hypothetical protein